MDRDKDALRPIVLEDGPRLRAEDLEAVPDDLRLVVRAAFRAGASTQPLDGDFLGPVELGRGSEAAAELREHGVERLGLGKRSREAVEDEAPLRPVFGELPADELDHELVRNEIAPIEDRLHAQAELAPGCDSGPENVAGRDLRGPPVGLDQFRLGALTGPRGAENDDIERHGRSYFRKPS